MEQVEFVRMLVPLGASNRQGKVIEPTYITIHETSPGTQIEPKHKDIGYYTYYIMNPSSEKEEIGFHYIVSDKKIVQFIPDNEFTRHCLDGNLCSIGIERIVNLNVNFEKAICNQARLAATLMKKHAIPLENVVPHKFWNGKQCPARLLAGMYGGWNGFVDKVEFFYKNKQFIIDCLD